MKIQITYQNPVQIEHIHEVGKVIKTKEDWIVIAHFMGWVRLDNPIHTWDKNKTFQGEELHEGTIITITL